MEEKRRTMSRGTNEGQCAQEAGCPLGQSTGEAGRKETTELASCGKLMPRLQDAREARPSRSDGEHGFERNVGTVFLDLLQTMHVGEKRHEHAVGACQHFDAPKASERLGAFRICLPRQ